MTIVNWKWSVGFFEVFPQMYPIDFTFRAVHWICGLLQYKFDTNTKYIITAYDLSIYYFNRYQYPPVQ